MDVSIDSTPGSNSYKTPHRRQGAKVQRMHKVWVINQFGVWHRYFVCLHYIVHSSISLHLWKETMISLHLWKDTMIINIIENLQWSNAGSWSILLEIWESISSTIYLMCHFPFTGQHVLQGGLPRQLGKPWHIQWKLGREWQWLVTRHSRDEALIV